MAQVPISRERLHLFESLEGLAWQPLETHEMTTSVVAGGAVGCTSWYVGWSGGVTKRANSVTMLRVTETATKPETETQFETETETETETERATETEDSDEVKAAALASLLDMLPRFERAYARKKSACAVRVSSLSWSQEMRDALSARGYQTEALTWVMHRDAVESPLSTVGQRVPTARDAALPEFSARVDTEPTANWLHHYGLWEGLCPDPELNPVLNSDPGSDNTASALATRAAIMRQGEALYVTVQDSAARAVAVGRVAMCGPSSGGVCVHNCLVVRPDQRRKGFGRVLMQTQLHVAARHGYVDHLVQVEDSNHGARALYEALDFRPVYSYEYYSLPFGPAHHVAGGSQ